MDWPNVHILTDFIPTAWRFDQSLVYSSILILELEHYQLLRTLLSLNFFISLADCYQLPETTIRLHIEAHL